MGALWRSFFFFCPYKRDGFHFFRLLRRHAPKNLLPFPPIAFIADGDEESKGKVAERKALGSNSTEEPPPDCC